MTYKVVYRMMSMVRNKRIALGMTQEETAKRLGISLSGYTKLENTKRQPSLDTVIKLAEVFNFSLDELIFGSRWQNNGDIRIQKLYDCLITLEGEKKDAVLKVLNAILDCF